MDRLYGDILPKDLILQLSLYLNYRDIWSLNDFSTKYKNICLAPDIWLYKIRTELVYSNDFINQYVYDVTNNTMKTLLPLNEKYMELKSRNSVDFGSEYFKKLEVVLYKAARSKDHNLARKLINYFTKWYQYFERDFAKEIIIGAISVANIDLVYDIMNKYLGASNKDYLRTHIVTMFGHGVIIQGYYEASQEIRNKINLQSYDVTPEFLAMEIFRINILTGLAAGNHLEELKSHNPDRTDPSLSYTLSDAANKNAAYDIINYYHFNNSEDLQTFVEYNGITDNINIKNISIYTLIFNGYIEYISNEKEEFYKKDLDYNYNLYLYIVDAIRRNHLDTVKRYANIIQQNINEWYYRTLLFESQFFENVLPETYEYIRSFYPDINSYITNKTKINMELRDHINKQHIL